MLNKTLDFSSLSDPQTPAAPETERPEDAGYAEMSETLVGMPAAADEDDEALEEYMNSMLERLTGNKKPSASPATSVSSPSSADATPAAPSAAPAKPAAEPVVEAVKKPVREPTRPSESKEDLSGMRALANQNVENALGVHSSRQLVLQTKSASFTAIGASVTSSLLIIFTQSQGSSPSWAYPAALAAMGAAFLMSARYYRLARRIVKIQRQLEVVTE